MPIRTFFPGKSFDPEKLAILNAAFEGACLDLGVAGRARHSREAIAKKVLELADGQRDQEQLRVAVVAALKATGSPGLD
jgi:hypothetical protein